jgi:hypothetical protein
MARARRVRSAEGAGVGSSVRVGTECENGPPPPAAEGWSPTLRRQRGRLRRRARGERARSQRAPSAGAGTARAGTARRGAGRAGGVGDAIGTNVSPLRSPAEGRAAPLSAHAARRPRARARLRARTRRARRRERASGAAAAGRGRGGGDFARAPRAQNRRRRAPKERRRRRASPGRAGARARTWATRCAAARARRAGACAAGACVPPSDRGGGSSGGGAGCCEKKEPLIFFTPRTHTAPLPGWSPAPSATARGRPSRRALTVLLRAWAPTQPSQSARVRRRLRQWSQRRPASAAAEQPPPRHRSGRQRLQAGREHRRMRLHGDAAANTEQLCQLSDAKNATQEARC